MDEFQRRLEAAFKPLADGETIRGVGEGILLGDDLIENTPILRHAGGRDFAGTSAGPESCFAFTIFAKEAISRSPQR
jgi:hypothetical protein